MIQPPGSLCHTGKVDEGRDKKSNKQPNKHGLNSNLWMRATSGELLQKQYVYRPLTAHHDPYVSLLVRRGGARGSLQGMGGTGNNPT